jgi:hypothetical protein
MPLRFFANLDERWCVIPAGKVERAIDDEVESLG